MIRMVKQLRCQIVKYFVSSDSLDAGGMVKLIVLECGREYTKDSKDPEAQGM